MEGNIGPEEALQRLMKGNERFVEGKSVHPNQGHDRRREVAGGQRPFAVVLGCSDSRIPPELVFDTGIGDLFVVRVAGNIADDAVLGSIEYAAEHLGVDLVMVLGHQKCGAIQACVAGGEPQGCVASVLRALKPAAEAAISKPGDAVDNTVRLNVAQVVTSVKAAQPVLSSLTSAGKLRVVGAYYSLDTGRVEILE
jgi:carbonic anhydrase